MKLGDKFIVTVSVQAFQLISHLRVMNYKRFRKLIFTYLQIRFLLIIH